MGRASVWMGTALFVLGIVGVTLGWRPTLNWTLIAVGLLLWVTALLSRRRPGDRQGGR